MLIYGGTEFSYAQDADFIGTSSSPKFWREVIDKFYDKYRGINEQHNAWMREAIETGQLLMPTGRIYEYYPDEHFNWPRTQILNYPVQGLGQDIMSVVRVLVHKRLKGLSHVELVSTVHDSIYTDCKMERMDTVVQAYKEAFEETPSVFSKLFGVNFNVPLRCEISIGDNMGEMNELKH